MKLALPNSVKYIIGTLAAHGFEAYAVGGCVRDAVLGREPDDWDITTSARPEQIKAVFRRTVDTGIAHGTVTVLHGGVGYEVTTYRIDGEYEDGRHPKEVSFTGNLKEDLRRRDFTINAMAYNERTGLVDAFGGLEDLERKRICCVGTAAERFGEDALRILRGVRFAAQLDFKLEEATKEAMKELAPTLLKVSAERIQAELSKLLLSAHPERIDELAEYGIASVIFPAYEGLDQEKRQFIMKQLRTLEERRRDAEQGGLKESLLISGSFESQPENRDNSGKIFAGSEQLALRWAAVLQFFDEKQAAEILHGLKYDNKTLRNVQGILKLREISLTAEQLSIRRALRAMGEQLFFLEMEFRLSRTENQAEIQNLTHMLELERNIVESGECTSLRELAVTGSDLISIGCPKGKQIGRVLNGLLELVLEDPAKNDRELLLAEAGKLFSVQEL